MVRLTKDLSRYTLLIRMVFEETGQELAIGSGFWYEYDNYYYLITNGHCVTGVNPETNTRLSKHAGYPTVVNAKPRIKLSDSNLNEDMRKEVGDRGYMGVISPNMARIDIYQDEECTKPAWYVHPDLGYKVDVVAIPVCAKDEVPEHVLVYPINKWALFEAEPEVADDVYILGYPFGITDPLELPIWKRGSIATEPSINYKNLPQILVDTATRQGMSGSPVILMRSGIHNMYGGVMTDKTTFGTIFGFVGVYSGRIGAKDEADAQLGIVWKKQVIEDILSAKICGSNDFQFVQ